MDALIRGQSQVSGCAKKTDRLFFWAMPTVLPGSPGCLVSPMADQSVLFFGLLSNAVGSHSLVS